MPNKPLLLLIRDGWGIGKKGPGDAVAAAKTPVTDALLAKYPHTVLEAAGEAVGVRAGSQGSSEVGHLNMGAGRIVEQEIVRVDRMIRDGSLFEVPLYRQAIERCKANDSAFHLMGLVQDQGVHSIEDHLFAFVRQLAKEGITRIFVHFFSDGRDTAPQSAKTFLSNLEAVFAEAGAGKVATVIGRYWAMDRGENWDRTEKAYNCMIKGEGFTAKSAEEAIDAAYARAQEQKKAGDDIIETDEFIRPTVIVDENDAPVGLIKPGDCVLHFNYRQDRALQMTKAFVDEDFNSYGFNRGPVGDYFFMGLTRYYDEFSAELVPPMNMSNLLCDVLSAHNLRQLRIAEFQKYKHVTSFFNGKLLKPSAGEDRIEVQSITIPEDQQPEMSIYPVTDMVLTAVNEGIEAVREKATGCDKSRLELGEDMPAGCPVNETYDTIMLNFANCDMVGHTGSFDAAVKAVESVDECTGKVVEAVLAKGGTVLVTADHGNAEQMVDANGGVQTSHTTNLVEFILVSDEMTDAKLIEKGKLADIAPTMLKILGVDQPAEMTAESIIE